MNHCEAPKALEDALGFECGGRSGAALISETRVPPSRSNVHGFEVPVGQLVVLGVEAPAEVGLADSSP